MQSDLPLPEKFTSFFEWLREQGAEFEKAELRQESENMRGIIANQDISKGETLIFVKIDQIITIDRAKRSPIGQLMCDKKLIPGHNSGLYSPKACLLAIYNMQERRKGTDSQFYHHLTVQPGLDDFPIFFGESELKYL